MTIVALKKYLINAGVSIAELIKEARDATPDEDGWNEPIPVVSGVSVKYVANPNYQGGARNGYGSGVYVTLHRTGYRETVPLELDK